MATFKTCVQKQRKDGFWPVYILITHNRKNLYVRTDKMVTNSDLSSNREVQNPYVLQYTTSIILEWNERLNRHDVRQWSVKQVAEFLQHGDDDVCFSDYARLYAKRLIDQGQERSSKNYMLALQHFERFAGTTKIMFSALTSQFVTRWIKSLEQTHRAKEMYPVCMRQVFKAALLEFNDYDAGITRIKSNPWPRVVIPRSDSTDQLAISAEACRAFFGMVLTESKFKSPLSELGRDVAMMVLCLAGMNTIDIFKLQKKDYYDGIIHYNRSKTMRYRSDKAYMEILVPDLLMGIFEKYLAAEDDEYLFDFHNRFCDSDSFNAGVNSGIKQVCKSMGMAAKERYSVYTFRHTWATIAQNDCGANLAEIGFGLNHSRGRSVTRGYIKLKFNPAWELNQKVVDYIFNNSPKIEGDDVEPHDGVFRLSKKYLVNAQAVYQGQTMVEFTDVGFANVGEVIGILASKLPDTIPNRAIVQFKIANLDRDDVVIYEKQKGKGF